MLSGSWMTTWTVCKCPCAGPLPMARPWPCLRSCPVTVVECGVGDGGGQNPEGGGEARAGHPLVGAGLGYRMWHPGWRRWGWAEVEIRGPGSRVLVTELWHLPAYPHRISAWYPSGLPRGKEGVVRSWGTG